MIKVTDPEMGITRPYAGKEFSEMTPPITISTAATQASQPAAAHAIAAQLVRTYGPDARTVAMRISAAIAEMEARP